MSYSGNDEREAYNILRRQSPTPLYILSSNNNSINSPSTDAAAEPNTARVEGAFRLFINNCQASIQYQLSPPTVRGASSCRRAGRWLETRDAGAIMLLFCVGKQASSWSSYATRTCRATQAIHFSVYASPSSSVPFEDNYIAHDRAIRPGPATVVILSYSHCFSQ